MTLKRPLLMQAAGGDATFSYSALDTRAMLARLLHSEGIAAPDVVAGSLKVSQRGAGANFSVDIAAGSCLITGDDVSDQGVYLCESTAVVNVATPTAPASGTRTHRVVARVKDKLHNGTYSTYEWTLECLTDPGTGVPAVPASAISLATVSIAAGQASVQTANITDTRASASLISAKFPQVSGTTTRPPAPFESELGWRTDLKIYEVWTGSAWRAVGPRVEPVTAVNADAGTTTSTSLTTTLTGASNNVTVAFVAPQSGKALVRAMALLKSDVDTSDTFFGARITLTSGGSTVYSPVDEELAIHDDVRNASVVNEYIVTGLTPGTSYTAVGVHKVQSGNTGNYDNRRITVEPI